jgi:hypothetical protein
MTYSHEILARFRTEELIREARRDRLARSLQPTRRRRPRP